MDRDSFVARHLPEWQRLDDLAGQRRHHGDEVDELVRLYQRASGHLSTARVRYADADLVLYLTRILSRANAVLNRPPSPSLARLRHALGRAVPLALWRTRWSIAAVAAVLLGSAIAASWWLSTTPGAIDFAMPADYRQYYVDEAFASYYSDGPAWLFAIRLFLNNARIALQMFGAGIALGLPTLAIAGVNGWALGEAGSVMADAGQAWTFWRLILPHGLLELTAIVVAGGAGLQVGWAVIAPGDRTRLRAVAEEGRPASLVAFAAAGALLLAAAIEAWITPSTLPDVVRIGIGVGALFAVVVGPMLLGRQLDAEASDPTGSPGPGPGHPDPVTAHSRPAALRSR